MRRTIAVVCALVTAVAVGATASTAGAAVRNESVCQVKNFACRDPFFQTAPNDEYIGHDEPTVEFRSSRPGTGGGDLTYLMVLPKNPPVQPNQQGTAGTWDFQLRATFWLGLTMCDTESFPNFTHRCAADSDANGKFTSTNPKSKHFLGKAPGSAFMELQFYEPGWVPQFAGFGCSDTQWCANLTIDSLSDNAATGVPQNDDCLNNHFLVGEEPVNWAYITKNGRSQAPANPLALSDDPNFTGLNPDLNKVLLMNSGDTIRVHMHDTRAGYRVDITDLSTGGHGSMTASKANGYGQILYQPKAKQCHVRPYAFHPMYDSASNRGTMWSAHTTNVSASDEIGHFENCAAIDANGTCTQPAGADTTVDVDDQACLNGADFNTVIPIIGCLLDDGDFDGPSYQLDWPGTFSNPFLDQQVHPTPMRVTVPTSHGRALEAVSFENDMPAIERGEPGSAQPECDRLTGANCVNPPVGAVFYPIYTAQHVHGRCMFGQGGTHVPGTFKTFGGSSATEYGTSPLFVTYPDLNFTTVRFAEDFRRDLNRNPCK